MVTDTNLADLRQYADAVREQPKKVGKAAVKALKAGAIVARDLATDAISKRYYLEVPYIQKHLSVKKIATVGDLLTKISATKREVLATRYGADQATVSTKTDRVKGDPYRKIPKGQKAAGSTPWAQKRGSTRKAWSNAFFIWGQTSGAWIMVTRRTSDKDSKLDAVLATSVDQAWRYTREDVAPAAMEVVVDTFIKEYEKG